VAGAGVGVGEEARRASKAFNAIALVVSSFSYHTKSIREDERRTIWRRDEKPTWRYGGTYLLRSASALAPPGPGNEEYPPATGSSHP
jgi:hypothetical protein